MKVSQTAALAGVRLTSIRDLCRQISFYAISSGFIADKLAVGAEFADEIANSMLMAGYLVTEPRYSCDRVTWYTLSPAGHALRNARFVKALGRDEADKKVKLLAERIHAINADDDLTHRIVEISAFGEYADGDGDVAGIDLVVTLAPRRSTFMEESMRRSDDAPGLRNYVSALLFGQNEVLDLVRGRDQFVTFHDARELWRRDSKVRQLFCEQVEAALASAA